MHARLLEAGRLWLSCIKQVDDMNTVPIVFAFDNNLVFPACVCLSSLMMSAKETTFYDIFILYPSSDEFERKDIDKVQEFYPNCRIQYIAVDDTFAGAFEIRGITNVTYYRLLIPELIPEYDKIIYSDVDVIFRSDLSKIYEETELTDCYIAGVNSLSHLHPDRKVYYKRKIGIDPQGVVYAGNIIINSKKMREDNLIVRFKDLSKQNYQFQDLDILNIACSGHIKQLPPSFCITTDISELSCYQKEELLKLWSKEELEEAMQEGIVHYNGQKPWKGVCINFDVWWQYYRNSPFYDGRFYFDFFNRQLYLLDTLTLWKRVKTIVRFFTVGRTR